MTQQTISGSAELSGRTERPAVAPVYAIRVIGTLLALGIAAVHVADQGGVSAFTSPDWLGWSYRLIEVGGVATALALLLPRPAWPGWAAGALLAAGPFIGYLASRTTGVPGDAGDVGNWGDWVGTVALLTEAALFVLSAAMLLAVRRRPRSLRPAAGRVMPTAGRPPASRPAADQAGASPGQEQGQGQVDQGSFRCRDQNRPAG